MLNKKLNDSLDGVLDAAPADDVADPADVAGQRRNALVLDDAEPRP